MESSLNNMQSEQLQLFISSLYKMKQENKYTDVILVCNDKEFPVHKVVLAAQSLFFCDIFDSPSEPTDFKKITLQWIDSDILELLLEFLYSQDITLHKENLDKMKQILDAAHKLKIEKLVGFCCECLMHQVSTNAFNDLILLAEKYKCQKLKTYIIEYLAENFDDSLDSRDILNLTPPNLRLIISHPLLAVDEDDKMRTVFKWIKHDEIARSKDFPILLPALDFGKLSTRFLITMADEEPLLSKSVPLMQHIIKAMASRLHFNIINHLQSCSCLDTSSSRLNSFSTSMTSGSSTVSQDSLLSSTENDRGRASWLRPLTSSSRQAKTEFGIPLDNAGIFLCAEENSLICSARMLSPRSSDKVFAATVCLTDEGDCLEDFDHRVLCENDLNMEEIIIPLPLVAMVCDIWDLVVSFINSRVSRELFLPSFLSLASPTS